MSPAGVRWARCELGPGVELWVYALAGSGRSVLIDSGVRAMRGAVLELCGEGGPDELLLTHVHADHIGCARSLQQAGARLRAPGALPWLEDIDTHYREFCRTEALPDSPEQRAEILELIEGPVRADGLVGEGVRIPLGDGRELRTLALPGHKHEEVGYLEPVSGTLFLGDALLVLGAPFFHGFQSARELQDTLDRLEGMVGEGRVARVLSSHHPPLRAEEILREIGKTRAHLQDIEAATLELAAELDLRTLWQAVSRALGKEPEFRGYAMMEAQVAELVAEGRLRRDGEVLVAG